MTMSSSTLSTQLQASLVNASTEALAVNHLVSAYKIYATDAAAGVAPITPVGLNLGAAAMTAALTGMSAPGAGAASIAAGIVAFWVAVAGGLATSFAGALAVVPPPLAGLAALLTATFASNTTGNLTQAQACNAIALNMHAQTIIGGTVTLAGPVVTPIL